VRVAPNFSRPREERRPEKERDGAPERKKNDKEGLIRGKKENFRYYLTTKRTFRGHRLEGGGTGEKKKENWEKRINRRVRNARVSSNVVLRSVTDLIQ